MINPSHGSPFPAKAHCALIEASLFEGEKARQSWQDWSQSTDFETEIDGPAFRLLPLLYHNLLRLGIDDPLMGRLKGIYRQSWSSNHILFLRAGLVIKLLNDNNIPVLVLKGIALTVLTYKNYGVRPMSDIDLLIKKEDVHKALNLLKDNDFTVDRSQSVEYAMRYSNSLSLTGPFKQELDMHWNPIVESNNMASKHDWWSGALPLEVGGQATSTMSRENMLLHTLVHGIRYNPEPPIRWIPDAHMLVKNGIDWKLFVKAAIDLRVGFLVMNGLTFLEKSFRAHIPDVVFEQLKDHGYTLSERLAFKYATSAKSIPPRSWTEKVVSNYFFYIRQTRFVNPIMQVLGFLKYSFFRLRTKSQLVESIHRLYSQLHLHG